MRVDVVKGGTVTDRGRKRTRRRSSALEIIISRRARHGLRRSENSWVSMSQIDRMRLQVLFLLPHPNQAHISRSDGARTP